jgi:hypothetical protein
MAPPPNLDRVQAVKWEDPSHGGTQTDPYPSGIDENEDALSARGYYFQPAGGPADEEMLVWRDGDNLKFQDKLAGPLTLSQLATGGSGITEAQHRILRSLIHFIEDGPAEGFATGAYREITGTVFPTAIVWWETSGKLKKIVERLITWTSGQPTTDKWKVYDTDGSTVLWTITDTISYSGAFETSRTRAIVSGDA